MNLSFVESSANSQYFEHIIFKENKNQLHDI